MSIDPEAIEDHVPYYLTQTQKQGLTKALADFNEHPVDYYTDRYREELLQGDGWTGLQVIQFDTGERASIKGIVLSNTCDVSADNARALPAKIVFAPIIRMSAYKAVLLKAGLKEDQVGSKFEAIRKQKITTLFYLPRGAGLEEEHIALLDDLHNIPLTAFHPPDDQAKLFTLSMVGFYLFVFKISVHFCRFHEEIER
jgi:hypothetical protein